MASDPQAQRERFEDYFRPARPREEADLRTLIAESSLRTLEKRLLELVDRARYYDEEPTLETLIELQGHLRILRQEVAT